MRVSGKEPKKRKRFFENDEINKMKINHVYEVDLRLLSKLDSGTHILFLKKKDIQEFKNGKKEFFVYYEKMHENYSKTYSLAHMISSHVNGLLIDEIKNILLHYHSEEYVIMPVVNYGQHFEYTSFMEEKILHEYKGKKTVWVMQPVTWNY